MSNPDSCGQIWIYSKTNQSVSASCNSQQTNFVSSAAVPVSRLRQACEGEVISCIEDRKYAQIAQGRKVLICLLCGCPELNKLSGKSYAKIAHGMFWEAFEGSIERITKLGEFVELIMIPCVIPEVGA